jgi:hypothetical protein
VLRQFLTGQPYWSAAEAPTCCSATFLRLTKSDLDGSFEKVYGEWLCGRCGVVMLAASYANKKTPQNADFLDSA